MTCNSGRLATLRLQQQASSVGGTPAPASQHTCSAGSAISASGVLVPAARVSERVRIDGLRLELLAPEVHAMPPTHQIGCSPAISRKMAAWSRRRKKARAWGCHVGRWYSADAPNMAVVLQQVEWKEQGAAQ